MLLHVKAIPNAKVTEFVERNAEGILRIKVHAAPEKGRANKELIDYLAKELKLQKKEVQLLKGEGARLKTFQIPDSSTLPW